MHVDLVLFVNCSHPLFSTAGFACECSVVLQLMIVMICTHAVVAAGFRVSIANFSTAINDVITVLERRILICCGYVVRNRTRLHTSNVKSRD